MWTNPRRLNNGSWIQPIYCGDPRTGRGGISSGVAFSENGHEWSHAKLIDQKHWDSDEPDIVALPNRNLLCIARPVKALHMWQSRSEDDGRTWSRWQPFPRYGHCPNLLLTSKGILLLAFRDPLTSMTYSKDYGLTWEKAVMIDSCGGAYPDMVELSDGTILVVYYTDQKKSEVRVMLVQVNQEGITPVK